MKLSDKFMQDYKKLKEYANYHGYRTLITYRGVSFCGHLTNNITISTKNGEKNAIFEFAHELGHCVQFRQIWKNNDGDKEKVKEIYRKRDKSKIRFMWDEIRAWLWGWTILEMEEINKKGYILHAFKCTLSHLKTKPSSVKGDTK
jgi:hypothetical protein